MGQVVQGFIVVLVIIGLGYAIARRGTLDDGGRKALAAFVFSVATPALLFDKLTEQTLAEVFSAHFAVVCLSSLAVGLAFYALCRLRGQRHDAAVIGGLGASYANGGNLGVPLAAYILQDASAVIPVMLFQIAFYAPVALTSIDVSRSQGSLWQSLVVTPLKNPMLIASLAGLAFVGLGVEAPTVLAEPVSILAGASVPLALVVFGMSLYGARVRWHAEVAVGAVFKNLVHPVVAGLLGAGVFGMEGAALQTAIMLGALPSAQNVYTYAVRYDIQEDFARDIGVVTTIVALPVMIGIALIYP